MRTLPLAIHWIDEHRPGVSDRILSTPRGALSRTDAVTSPPWQSVMRAVRAEQVGRIGRLHLKVSQSLLWDALKASLNWKGTSTCLYRSCAALASSSGPFDLILFQAVNFEFIVEKVWFGLVCLIEFGLVWFGCSTYKQTNNNYLI